MSQPSKFIFFGTPYVARDTLEILHARGYTPSLIVTSPDRPRGRGLVLTPTEVREWALAHDIPTLTPEKITDDVIAEIRAQNCEYAIVVAYGKILPQALIDAFPLGIINIHYSLLPKYRGASPVESALLNGDAKTGVAIQKMVSELDAGDIIAMQETDIGTEETTRELRARLIPMGAELLADILPKFEAGEITPTPQDSVLATKCKKIKKEDGQLDIRDSSPENQQLNWNKYRAYAEWPGTYFFVEKNRKQMRVKIAKAIFTDGTFRPTRVIPEGKSEQDFAVFTQNYSL